MLKWLFSKTLGKDVSLLLFTLDLHNPNILSRPTMRPKEMVLHSNVFGPGSDLRRGGKTESSIIILKHSGMSIGGLFWFKVKAFTD
jgi:hypothetical protein